MKSLNIALAAGGTGGHIFPAESLAFGLKNRGYKIAMITDTRAARYFKKIEDPTYCISTGTFTSGSLITRIKGIFSASIGFFEAIRILRRFKPNIVVGFGGFPTVPTISAAIFLGIPTLIHEQNAVLGRANRFLSSRVKAIGLSFSKTKYISEKHYIKSKLVGIPVRKEIISIKDVPYIFPLDTGQIKLMVLGGSQGAEIFSKIVPEALGSLKESLRSRLFVIHQCRKENIEKVRSLYLEYDINVELSNFIDVPSHLQSTHLVISRSGASTLAELMIAGRPAILIPYPYAIDDHQTKNAELFVNKGCGWLSHQSKFTSINFRKFIEEILSSPIRLNIASESCKKEGSPNALENLVKLVEQVSNNQFPDFSAIPNGRTISNKNRRDQ